MDYSGRDSSTSITFEFFDVVSISWKNKSVTQNFRASHIQSALPIQLLLSYREIPQSNSTKI